MENDNENIHQVIVIGGGPAGLTAAIYASRAELKPLVIEGYQAGGQLMGTTDIENFPGVGEKVTGPQLIMNMKQQAQKFGTEFLTANVDSINLTEQPYEIKAGDKTFLTQTLIIATGADARWLGLESEEKMKGRGVSACATCLPTGSNIIANNSPKPINEMEEGERVMTHDGTFQKVAGKGSRDFKGKLVKIIPRYFREEPTLLTPEHPVYVTTMNRGTGPKYWDIKWGEPHWVPAGELKKEHILLYPIVSETKDVSEIRLSDFLNLNKDEKGYVKHDFETHTARRIPNVILVNKDFMRLVGYFLAEGSITNRGINFYFSVKEEEYVLDVQKIMNEVFDYKVNIRNEGSVTRIECYAGIIRDFFEKMLGKYSYGKSLPHWFIYLPKEKQMELMKGYYRGDGGLKPKAFSLVTNSSKLVAQFKTILLRLGIVPGITKRLKEDLNRTKNIFEGREIQFKHDRYEFDICGAWLKRAGEVFGVEHPHLKNKTRDNQFAWVKGNYVYLPIRTLETEDYEGEVHNIAVENNNTYVTPGTIVHNCDGAFFKDKEIAVIGGGDSAMEEANFLTRFASKVTIIHRRDELRASKIMQEKAKNNPKIEFKFNAAVEEVLGETTVTGLKLKDTQTGETSTLECQGVFISIGHKPNTTLFKDQLELDQKAYIVTKANSTVTSKEGVFACGDVQDHVFRQAITAAGSGCMAAIEVERYLAEKE